MSGGLPGVVRSVEAGLKAGTAVIRYGRIWRLGQWRWQSERRSLTGRIGYEREGELTELWDFERNDFVEARLPEGVTAPFVVDVERGLIAFQLRPGRIERQSFAGAFRKMLNETDPSGIWKVEPFAESEPWWEWQERAARIQRIEIRIERPNPHFGGRREVEALVDGHRARVVKLIFEAYQNDPQGLEIDEFLREAAEQALYRGNLKAIAEFDTELGPQERVWRKDVEGSPVERKVPADPQTGEASPEAIEAELEDRGDALP